MSLWDAESRIRQMVQLIEQEAAERAATVINDARQRMEREKNKIYAAERERVLREVGERAEGDKLAKRLERSQKVNEVRLQVQRHREKLLEKVLEQARAGLVAAVAETAAYGELLSALMLDGVLRLLEADVQLVVRAEDVALARSLLPAVIERYKVFLAQQGLAGRELALRVLEGRHLASEDIGGVVLFCLNSRVSLDNTLKARLELVFAQSAPDVRQQLFPSLATQTG